MQDLRLIGVHEDGQHLLLSDADGGRYRLPSTTPCARLPAATAPAWVSCRSRSTAACVPATSRPSSAAGLSTEEVADRAGWTVEKVRRFEGPVLAEREHVAAAARSSARSEARGQGPITLAERVAERLRERAASTGRAVRWDSARDEEGAWTVTADLPRRWP